MVTHEPYRIKWSRLLRHTVCCVALLTPLGLLATSNWQKQSAPQSLPSVSDNAPSVYLDRLFDRDQPLANILSPKDITLYQTIFIAQKKSDWTSADAAIAQLRNPILVGHILAERYLSRHYITTPIELSDWLNRYSDHPQAADIYVLALAKMPSLKSDVPLVRKQPSLGGYGDDIGLAMLSDEHPYIRSWQEALGAWRLGHKAEAAKLFSTMAQHPNELSPWMASAAAYWSYRAYNALDQHADADMYLKMAAQEPRSFYGILARKQLKEQLSLDTKPVELTDSDILEMIGDPPIRRTIALVQAGFPEIAERELRALFPQADEKEKSRLLALAHNLHLASVQIGMAKQLSQNGRELDLARYPIPDWQPEGGFRIDPSLIFAFMRQESGFRASAVSSGGALGLMQLMPQTALLMQKRIDNNTTVLSANISEPVFNMTLGQHYIEHLLNNNLVEGNLLYLLTAYNAGPGRLQSWKERISNNDPLLFIESIPYPQTRYYVMQVMTNYWIYSELTGKPSNSVYALLHGRWPSYDARAIPVADASLKVM